MEKGSLVCGAKETRGLLKLLSEEKLEKTVFNAFFEPTYKIFGK
jgi:hypothetical protein